jgi:hypothetical protein
LWGAGGPLVLPPLPEEEEEDEDEANTVQDAVELVLVEEVDGPEADLI